MKMLIVMESELKRIREKLRLSQPKFAALLGLSSSRYASYEYERAQVPEEILEKARALNSSDPFSQLIPTRLNPNRKAFPLLGSAGASKLPHYPIETTDYEEYIEFANHLYDETRPQFAIRIVGDSAAPDIAHGDYVLVTVNPSFRHLGFLVLVKCPDNGFFVKVLAKTPDGLVLRSINSDYDDIPLSDGCEMVGVVVGWKRLGNLLYIEAGQKDGLKPGFRD